MQIREQMYGVNCILLLILPPFPASYRCTCNWTGYFLIHSNRTPRCTHAPAPTHPQVYGASNFWGWERFLPEFPQTCTKNFWATFCANIFSPRPFLWWSPKRGLRVLLQTLVAIFLIKPSWAPFLSIFSGSLPRFSRILRRFPQILPRFSPNQNFWRHPPAPPPPTCSLVNCRGPLVCKQQTSLCLFIDIINFPSITFSSRPEGSKMKVSQSAKECHTWFHGGGKIQINCCIY